MDGNKDEAQRCINIALDAAKSGDLQRAEKFLRKADNLYPSQKAKGKFHTFLMKVNVLRALFILLPNRSSCSNKIKRIRYQRFS